MFRLTRKPSSGSHSQYLAKITHSVQYEDMEVLLCCVLYAYTVYSTHALQVILCSHNTGNVCMPRPLYHRERAGTHCIGGWVGLRAGLDGCGKSRPHRDSTQTVQPVASRYTDWAIPAHSLVMDWSYNKRRQKKEMSLTVFADDGRSRTIRKVGKLLPNYTES